MARLNARNVRLISVAGILCWIAALFYFIYIKNYEAPGFLILVVFFVYFLGQRKWSGSDNASNPFKFLQQDGGSPIRELVKGLGCVVVGVAIAAAAGLAIQNVELSVAIALTAVVIGIVAFVLFLVRALRVVGSQGTQ
jgi:hypothetical protein